jgi:hypothetical protein
MTLEPSFRCTFDCKTVVERAGALHALECRLCIGEYLVLPDDRLSFWTGKYPTAGTVRAFMCEGCSRIALYGGEPEADLSQSIGTSKL